MKKLMLYLSLIILSIVASNSHAVPIDGSILFSSASWSTDLSTLTVIDPTIVPGFATGDLAGETTVTVANLDYAPFSAIDPLWTSNNFAFAIDSVTVILNTLANVVLEGTGTLRDLNGVLDDTSGIWAFSGGTINWSSATATAAPEPATMLLLGLGLIGIAGLARKKSCP